MLRLLLIIVLTIAPVFLALPALAEGPAKKGEMPWSFRPVVRPQPPQVRNTAWVRNPIDAFIVARLEKEGLRPSPVAEPAQLLRRLFFDLTGLPPTPEQVQAFVKDPSPQAYDRLVDQLLASPRYGERMATFWFDLVRYAETDGFRADDVRPHAWRYRDYVIDAFNRDLPYDRFIQEQIAGDELFPEDPRALVATGFLRHYPDEWNAVNLDQRRQEILNDITDTTTQTFLGLTVGCARCHDHKYDPILQKDYYRLQAFFVAYGARTAPLLSASEKQDFDKRLREWEAKAAPLQQKLKELQAPYEKKLEQQRRSRFAPEFLKAFDTPPEKRTVVQEQYATMMVNQIAVDQAAMVKAMKPEVKQQWEKYRKELTELEKSKPTAPTAMIMTDVSPQAPPHHLLKRGNHRFPGEEVQPGFLSILDPKDASIQPPRPDARTTGRRSVLAKWLSSPDNPLPARVMVNRLWQHHFGRGLVATPGDFGAQGEPPTHPELLDWLARELMDRGWSLKTLHRLMVTSATYRQTAESRHPPAVDPDNRLLWRMNRKRLEGEAIRDAMLQVSGQLNLKMGGPSIFPELPEELGKVKGWQVTADIKERNRRSIYVFAKRNLRYPLFSVFDAPDANETCARRHVTTTAPQALMLLNSRLTLEMAQALAGRLLRETEGNVEKAVERAWWLTLARGPETKERTLAEKFLREQTEAMRQRLAQKQPVALPVPAPSGDSAQAGALVQLCHVLLNINEFVYLD